MKTDKILFFDLEADKKTRKIQEFGAILDEKASTPFSLQEFSLLVAKSGFLCGHNILDYDIPLLEEHGIDKQLLQKPVIDTLYLSPLLFPKKPYHRLIKDYKLVKNSLSDPVADSDIAKTLFLEEIEAFRNLDAATQTIYAGLLQDTREFSGFFAFLKTFYAIPAPVTGSLDCPLSSAEENIEQLETLFRNRFRNLTCRNVDFAKLAKENPVETAYVLALVATEDPDSITPPWVLHTKPEVSAVFHQLRFHRCNYPGCDYCDQHLNPLKVLKRHFGYSAFRRFEGDGEIPLQEQGVRAALEGKSFLCIFPTGGGKSLTFQLPALMAGDSDRSLTVVISPLQSLMKDQVDVLKKRFCINGAVALYSDCSPLERQQVIEQVEQGGANLLYISPEALRSNTIHTLLKNRRIARFVIDEAHCLSTWGHDFRVDYLHIADAIKELTTEKGLPSPIPVSCFTATAKKAVIEDIQTYFRDKTGHVMEVFATEGTRKNLSFGAYETPDVESKDSKLLKLIQADEKPKIVYVSSVQKTHDVAEKLKSFGCNAAPYNAKIESELKIETQNKFMKGEIDVIVATTAFGMGVDKEDVSTVIHYDISSSLENYVQEAGRAGRNPEMEATCHILFDENDLDRHFQLLNASKLSKKEIDQVWNAIKKESRNRFSKSALEIAREAGWDTEINDLETRVKAAISSLEQNNYIKRERNQARIQATSFLVKTVAEIQDAVQNSGMFTQDEIVSANRVAQYLFTAREVRVEYLADALYLDQELVVSILSRFYELRILSDDRHLSAFVTPGRGRTASLFLFERIARIEVALAEELLGKGSCQRISLRDVTGILQEQEIECTAEDVKAMFFFWKANRIADKERIDATREIYNLYPKMEYGSMKREMLKRHSLAEEVLKFLLKKADPEQQNPKVEFLIAAMKQSIESALLREPQPLADYEKALLFLHEFKAVKLGDGLTIFYAPLKIERLENRRAQYKDKDYKELQNYYQGKKEQIHIVGEYAKKALRNWREAMEFLDNYFKLPYKEFIRQYFPGEAKEALERPITEKKFKELFSQLSPEQLAVVKDKENEAILVSAGPGSGKTRTLVHKLASLLLVEETKPEQLLMLTFSRPAAIDFRQRLAVLAGASAYRVDIHTYHGYAFKLLGVRADPDDFNSVIQEVTEAIRNGGISVAGKTTLVVDEYQDINEEGFRFIEAIAGAIDHLKVIVVGDDDQNVYEFRGSSVKYMRDFETNFHAKCYFLGKNYRSRSNLVEFANSFIAPAKERMKAETPIFADSKENGTLRLMKYQAKDLILPLIQAVVKHNETSPFAILSLSKDKGGRGDLDSPFATMNRSEDNENGENSTSPFASPKGGRGDLNSIGVLTNTNEEALLITHLLKQEGVNAQLIVSGSADFSLGNLLELRIFDDRISKAKPEEKGDIGIEDWKAARERLEGEFGQSKNIDLALEVIDTFARENKYLYYSAWRGFLREIRMEEFSGNRNAKVVVSTFHKAKGREFDSVFLLHQESRVGRDRPQLDEQMRRVLYVSITRARENLFIHTNQSCFDKPFTEPQNVLLDTNHYEAPEEVVLQLGLKHVNLGFFKLDGVVRNVKNISTGRLLTQSEERPEQLMTEDIGKICALSKQGLQTLQEYQAKGYAIERIECDYIVVWKDQEVQKEFRVVLPKVFLTKKST